jgi:hypothetical protein
MPRRRKTDVDKMWINPCSNFGHPHEWDRRSTDASNARYLELADVALRPKPPGKSEAVAPLAAADDIVRIALPD